MSTRDADFAPAAVEASGGHGAHLVEATSRRPPAITPQRRGDIMRTSTTFATAVVAAVLLLAAGDVAAQMQQ